MSQRQQLMANERLILRQLSYVTRVVLPHPLALTYIQTIFPPGSAIGHARKRRLAERVIALLNSALLSPQLLYLTHQPHALAVAAIYLAARETGLRIADNEWWLVWDVTREELGFLVLAFRSVETWVEAEHAQQKQRLWTVSEVEKELERLHEHGVK
jgi:cyclin L